MDPELMQMMARFKLRMRRVLNQTVDTYRFLEDRDYAFAMLKIADGSDDEDLIIMSMRVSDMMGMMPGGNTTPKALAKEAAGATGEGKEEKPKDRYMFGARG